MRVGRERWYVIVLLATVCVMARGRRWSAVCHRHSLEYAGASASTNATGIL